MATISACAVGSFADVTLLPPLAMIRPLRTMTAPNGPPRFLRTAAAASRIAAPINASWQSQALLGILVIRLHSERRPSSADAALGVLDEVEENC